ncbi:MAG: aminotransferase class I/II-fold pyridoxal phosphate-dependent enzyme [Sphingobacteriales bacterium]|nr:aminotransferase class I/II-fold pyridoxal phosphate-dependent enzyme [Sphingobacteriales bacterium]
MKTISIKSLVCPHVLTMNAYSSARMEYEGKEGVFLDANENSLGSVTDELHNRYPDPLQTDLKIELARYENLHSHQIFLGNGSDECINVLIQCFCISGKDKAMVFPPSFSMYEHASHVMNIELVEVLLLEETFQLNLGEILKQIQQDEHENVLANEVKQSNVTTDRDCFVPYNDGKVKIIFICSPNNPTGNLMHERDIEELLNAFDGLVVIDEAYQDFAGSRSWTERLDEFQNLVVIKTFSKAWGMADARLGMLYANPEIIHYMNVIKMPYNVSQHTIQLALEALQKKDKKEAFIRELLLGRAMLEREMQKIPFVEKIYPSDTNFILFRVPDANDLYKYLLGQKVIVRNRDKAPLLKGCLRVSVGTKDENEKFMYALKNYKA